MRISDWSSDVCSSDLGHGVRGARALDGGLAGVAAGAGPGQAVAGDRGTVRLGAAPVDLDLGVAGVGADRGRRAGAAPDVEADLAQLGRAAGRERVCQSV